MTTNQAHKALKELTFTRGKYFYPKHYIAFSVYILSGHDALGIKPMTLSVL